MDKNLKNTKKTKAEQYKDLKHFLKLYVVPLLAIIIFVGLLFFLIVPKIQSMMASLDENEQLNEELVKKSNELEQIEKLNENINDLNENILIIDSIAPTGRTEVVSFRDRISALAERNGLTIESQVLNEIPVIVNPGLAQQQILFLREVPVNFNVIGNYNDVLRFINQIDDIEDFLVFKEFSLNRGNTAVSYTEADWTLNLQLVKYQFEDPSEETTITRYLSVPPTAKISEIMKNYIDARK